MRKAEISEARTKKMPPIRKLEPPRWQARTPRLMSNRKPILRAKCAGEPVLLRPALSPLPRQLPGIFSSDSLGYGGSQRPRPRRRRLIASVGHHNDEHPTRIIAAVYLVSS